MINTVIKCRGTDAEFDASLFFSLYFFFVLEEICVTGQRLNEKGGGTVQISLKERGMLRKSFFLGGGDDNATSPRLSTMGTM
jgi:hypothetical protein